MNLKKKKEIKKMIARIISSGRSYIKDVVVACKATKKFKVKGFTIKYNLEQNQFRIVTKLWRTSP